MVGARGTGMNEGLSASYVSAKREPCNEAAGTTRLGARKGGVPAQATIEKICCYTSREY